MSQPIQDLVRKHFPPGSINVLDVGARWGSKGAWWRLGSPVFVHGFEPDAAECERLNKLALPGERYHPVALGSLSTIETLHLASERGGSSLLPLLDPTDPRIAPYPLISAYTEVGQESVLSQRYDDWVTASSPQTISAVDFVKADVQGFENYVFKGMGAHLERVLGVEAEVSFNEMYEGQPLFGDVARTLRRSGLEVWRIDHLVHYQERHSDRLRRTVTAAFDNVHTSTPGGSGRLFWANAVFFRPSRSIPLTSPTADRDLLVLGAFMEASGDRDGAAGCLRWLLSGPPRTWSVPVETIRRALAQAEAEL